MHAIRRVRRRNRPTIDACPIIYIMSTKKRLQGEHLTTASSSHEHWTLLYDADCGFCKWIVSGVLAWDRQERLVPCALQSAQGQALLSDLRPAERLASVHLISPDGERLSAGSALAPLLRLLPAGTIPAHGIASLPRLTNRAYDWVADHRSQLSRAVPGAMKRNASARVSRAEVERSEKSVSNPVSGSGDAACG